MADEITLSIGFRVAKGSLVMDRSLNTFKSDMSGSAYSAGTQEIGTTYEQVTVAADVATPGWARLRNISSENFVEVGVEVSAAFYPLLKLNPGEAQLIRLATDTFFARADTAAVRLETTILAD